MDLCREQNGCFSIVQLPVNRNWEEKSEGRKREVSAWRGGGGKWARLGLSGLGRKANPMQGRKTDGISPNSFYYILGNFGQTTAKCISRKKKCFDLWASKGVPLLAQNCCVKKPCTRKAGTLVERGKYQNLYTHIMLLDMWAGNWTDLREWKFQCVLKKPTSHILRTVSSG